MSGYHTSVLLNEAIEYLHVTRGEKYIDATLGGGGHTAKILELGGIVLSLDVDQDALDFAQSKFKMQSSKFKVNKDVFLVRGNFRNVGEIAQEYGFEKVSGILFDIGVSGHQFDEGERGFSFREDAPLDMRMDKELSVTAADLVNGLTKEELTELFVRYGEEPFAKRIAANIVEQRKRKTIETTTALADVIKHSIPKQISHGGEKKTHPATKVFQALRIAVNDELHSLEEGLLQAEKLLLPKGRIVVISFHSLEDRIVKNIFVTFEKQKKGEIVTEKPIEPSYEEIEANKRSRSAKLRVFQKA